MNDFPGGAADQRELPTQRGMDLGKSRSALSHGTRLRLLRLVDGMLARIAARGDDHVWIDRLPRDEFLAYARRLEADGPAGKPLYGIPFAIKDNIDLAGHPTTAGCPAFAYVAQTRRRPCSG